MNTGDPALRGVRILEFSQAIYGALAGQLLGDAGADVIKIEPPWGDFSRVAHEGHGRDSTMWLGTNRSKRNLTINLRTEKGREVVRRMVPASDVIIHNHRPGVMEKLGLDFVSARNLNPRIVHVSLYPYGAVGPMARWAGGDMWAQAFGGVVAAQGARDDPPALAGVALVDHGGAALAAFSVLAALRRRDVTGEPQEITSSLLESVLFMQAGQVGDYLIGGRDIGHNGRGWRGWFPYGAYTASDGEVVIIHGGTDDEWKTLLRILDLEELAGDPRYATAPQRLERRAELYPKLDAGFSKKTRAEWQVIFRGNGLRCDPCLTYTELFEHPQVAANEIVLEWQRSGEDTQRSIGVPYTVGRLRPRPDRAPPHRAQYSREVLLDYGFEAGELDAPISEGVVMQDDG